MVLVGTETTNSDQKIKSWKKSAATLGADFLKFYQKSKAEAEAESMVVEISSRTPSSKSSSAASASASASSSKRITYLSAAAALADSRGL